MTTGATNLDILELSIPSIEADEIHSGSAVAGSVLTDLEANNLDLQRSVAQSRPCSMAPDP
jgi:hypothetical protein